MKARTIAANCKVISRRGVAAFCCSYASPQQQHNSSIRAAQQQRNSTTAAAQQHLYSSITAAQAAIVPISYAYDATIERSFCIAGVVVSAEAAIMTMN
ncbi:MAG: hypothetical protein EOP56_10460 [Sphingobacteriales bacterium]|nr:MAG: hypothetical protein EOP56_10460 [Sphingobacteriales bacterium]